MREHFAHAHSCSNCQVNGKAPNNTTTKQTESENLLYWHRQTKLTSTATRPQQRLRLRALSHSSLSSLSLSFFFVIALAHTLALSHRSNRVDAIARTMIAAAAATQRRWQRQLLLSLVVLSHSHCQRVREAIVSAAAAPP